MDVKPCNECPDSVQRHVFDGKEYVLVGDMYVSFYTMALLLFSDVPDAKARLDRAMGPIPGRDDQSGFYASRVETISTQMVGGLDAEMRKGMR
jgi:hypothetical protein